MKTILLSASMFFAFSLLSNAQNSLVKNYQQFRLSQDELVDEKEEGKEKGKIGSELAAYANEYEELNSGLNTYGYIVWGTEEELLADGIISKDSSWSYKDVASFGREEMEMFVQVETDSLSSINIPGVLKYMLTEHAQESYEIAQGEVAELKIIEKEKFWTKGNFLVVVTK